MYARLLFREELGGEDFFLFGREGGFEGGELTLLQYLMESDYFFEAYDLRLQTLRDLHLVTAEMNAWQLWDALLIPTRSKCSFFRGSQQCESRKKSAICPFRA